MQNGERRFLRSRPSSCHQAKKAFPVMMALCFVFMVVPSTGTADTDDARGPGDITFSPKFAGSSGGHFTENLGQWPEHVGLAAETSFGRAVFGDGVVTYDLLQESGGHRVNLHFEGDGTVGPRGVDDLGYPSNYFLGNDPDGWVTGARSYREVVYEDAWPGVDIRYRFADGWLKYDLMLDADADPSVVKFRVEGAEGLDITDDGLAIRLSPSLSVEDRELMAWYGDGEPVDVSFRLEGETAFGFLVDKDEGRSMVIDPVVVHSSTLVGGSYIDGSVDIEVDSKGNVYFVGQTNSPDFPVTIGEYDDDAWSVDIHLTKMNRNCSRIIWSTIFGGSSIDMVIGLEVDANKDVYVCGHTMSKDFPTTNGSLSGLLNLGAISYAYDAWVVKFNNEGDELMYSTYVGGSFYDVAGDFSVRRGKVALVGMTESKDFPTESGAYGGVHGDAFLVVLDKNGSRIEDTHFWGGFSQEGGLAVDYTSNGDIVIGGRTSSADFLTTPGVFQELRPTFSSGFVTKYSPINDSLVFCTFFGGGGGSAVFDLEVDDQGYIYLGGYSFSGGIETPFPVTDGAFKTEFHGWIDGFLAKMHPDGTRLEYCTLIGGDERDYVNDIELDRDGNLVAVGYVESGANYTLTPGCHDDVWAGESEGFVFVLNAYGSAPVYSSFHGGELDDMVTSVEVDPVDNLVVSGSTDSRDFPLKEDGYQTRPAGSTDCFVSVIGELSPTSAPRDLEATGGEGYIALEWKPPLYDGGYPVRDYLLYRGTNETQLHLYKVLDTVNEFHDGDVEWGVTYHYAVVADNWKGRSLMSNVASARSVTVPDPPVNLTGTVLFDSVLLKWQPPAFTGGIPVTGYMLYRTAEGDHVEVTIPLGPDPMEFGDTEVRDGTVYTYSMTVLNEYGESRSIASVTLRTKGVPTPPLDLEHTYGDQFVRLRWEPPADDFGLPVTGYTVHRQEGDGPFEQVGEVTSPPRTFLDTGVEVGVPYQYNVRAVNAKGPSEPSEAMEAYVMVTPGPPTQVEAVATERFIRISWSPPEADGASPVLGYRVYLCPTMDDAVSLGGINVAGLEDRELSFLHEVAYDGMLRQYLVTAVNAEGESGPSEVASTRVYQPPAAPGGLQVEWDDGELRLSWQPPTSDGGTPVVLYTLYRVSDEGADFLPLVTLGPTEMVYADIALENGQEYSYRVTATNLAGESEPCPSASAIPAGIPDVPGGLVATGGIGMVHLAWNAPSQDGGHPVSGYLVYRMTEGGSMEPLAELGPETMELVDSEVETAVVYMYTVVAFTDAGESSKSDVASAMPYGPPGAPISLVAVLMDGYLHLTWSSPLDDGGNTIMGYHLFRHDRADGNVTDLAATDLAFLDHSVEPGKTYNYTVTAFNAAGDGLARTVSFTVPLPEPEPPESSSTSPWLLLAIVVVLVAIVVSLLAMMGRRKDPGIPLLFT